MRIQSRLEALEHRRPKGTGAVIVKHEGDEFTDSELAEMQQSQALGIPPLIIVIDKPKPNQLEFCKSLKGGSE